MDPSKLPYTEYEFGVSVFSEKAIAVSQQNK